MKIHLPPILCLFAATLALLCAAPAQAQWRTHPLRDPCAIIPQGAQPAPNGFYVREWEMLHVTKAQQDAFVIYLHEWWNCGTTLSPYGETHLKEIAQRLPHVPFPVVIQPEVQPELNHARQLAIINALASLGVADAANRVIIDLPRAEALYGIEAPFVYRQFILSSLGMGGFGGRGFGGGMGRGMGGMGGFGRGMGGMGGFGGLGGGMGGFGGFGGRGALRGGF